MRSLTAVLFALILASPLAAVPGTGFDAFRLPVVLALASVLLACLFLRSSRGGDRPPGPAPLRTAGVLLLIAHLASLATARSVSDAVGPLLTLAAGLATYSCMKGGLLRKERALTLLPVLSVAGLVIAAVGIVQAHLKMEAVTTEGNRNYAGALAAMLLPPAVAFTRRGAAWERLAAALAAVGLVAVLLLSESRGGFLAALAGLSAAGWALASGKVPRGLLTAAGALLALVAAFGAGQGREQLSERRLDTARFRLEAWKSGARMFLQRPVLGWGSGAFQAEYPPFRSEAEFRISHSDGKDGFKEVEDPHSSWVATGVETGAFGLLGFLLVAYVSARLWRHYVRRATDPDSAAALAGLGGGALAYLVAGGFNTLTIHASHTVLFWAFLGLIEVLGDRREWRQGGRAREIRVAIPAAAAIVLLFGAFWTARLGGSDRSFTAAMGTADAKARERALREAIDANPQSWRAHLELSRTLSHLERHAGAAEEARQALKRRPYHVDALNQAAVSILRAGGDVAEAERDLRLATEVAPYYYKSYFNLALLEGQRGRSKESRALLTRSIEHKPDHGASYYYRGLAFLTEGEAASALADLMMARGLRYDVVAALRADRPSALNDPRFEELLR